MTESKVLSSPSNKYLLSICEGPGRKQGFENTKYMNSHSSLASGDYGSRVETISWMYPIIQYAY